MLSLFTWQGFGQWMFLASAFGFLLLLGWRWDRRRRDVALASRGQASEAKSSGGPGGRGEIVAYGLAAAWSLVVAGMGHMAIVSQLFETLRTLGWLGLTLVLFSRDGRHTSV
ncbi:MAG: hypothetical protein RIS85_2270, partial [Pseudomonadota bacterium]